jgi:ribonuclease HII
MTLRSKPQLRPDLSFELDLLQSGVKHVAGLDEAGRGAWAGPVYAAAVILPINRFDLARCLEGVRDSKQMTPAQRERWAIHISKIARAIGVGQSSAGEVDSIGLISATRLAMTRALAALREPAEHLLIDYIGLPDIHLPQTPLPHGDARVLSIAAASVIAKVARDRAMVAFDEHFPGYGFSRHKGYGTSHHRHALQRLGPCPIHRRTYAPVAALTPHHH